MLRDPSPLLVWLRIRSIIDHAAATTDVDTRLCRMLHTNYRCDPPGRERRGSATVDAFTYGSYRTSYTPYFLVHLSYDHPYILVKLCLLKRNNRCYISYITRLSQTTRTLSSVPQFYFLPAHFVHHRFRDYFSYSVVVS